MPFMLFLSRWLLYVKLRKIKQKDKRIKAFRVKFKKKAIEKKQTKNCVE